MPMDDNQTLRSMVRDDAYRVVRVLADGPSGKTELVTFDGEGPLVRKHIPNEIANASAWAAAMELDEPLLPRIESLYRMPDELVVVYEYVQGESLAQTVRTSGARSPERAVEIVCDVCKAVGALHGRGVVHRDITPGNVILAADGAHLVDLGIARQQVAGQSHDTTRLGTWGFAAPEQYGFAQTDARSDVYSLGRLLGYALTGIEPDADNFEAVLYDPSQTDERLAQVVRKATSFEPSARYQSAAELATAARAALRSTHADATDRHESMPAASSDTSPEGPSPTMRAPYWWQSAQDLAKRMSVAAQTFSGASLLARILAIAAWIVDGFFVLVILLTDLDALIKSDPPYGPAQYAMSVTVIGACFVLAREVYCVATRTGTYAESTKRAVQFITLLCKLTAIVFIALFIEALLLPGGAAG